MSAIETLQEFVPWASRLPLAPKIIVSVIVVSLTSLILLLIWSKPPVKDEAERRIWQKNLAVLSLFTPLIGNAEGTFTIKKELLDKLGNLDFSGELELESKLNRLKKLIEQTPLESERSFLGDNKKIYDLKWSSDIRLLYNEINAEVIHKAKASGVEEEVLRR